MTTGREVMEIMLKLATEYKADMDPQDGIIRFILPKNDKDNPTGKDVQVEVNILNNTMRMTNVKAN
jgi:hypothetical protein